MKQTINRLLLLALCVAGTLPIMAPLSFGAPLSAEKTAAIDALIDNAAKEAHMPSAVVLIDRGGETIYEHATGLASISLEMATTPETAYGIGSITKSVTGLAIALLAHEGKVDLEATVAEYLPEYQGPGAVATVAQLLTHTSGIPNYTNEIGGIRQSLERKAYTREEMVALFEALPLNFAPGERFSYSNSGYYLLGLIIERASGMDYYRYLQEAIFEPLDMQRTSSGDYRNIVPIMARGYDLGEDGFQHAAPWHYLVPFSAGSLVSTAGDLVKYRRGVFHNPAIAEAVRETILRITPLKSGEPNIYALGGLIVSDFNGLKKISHAGDIWGFTSNHSYYPEEDITIVFLTNRQLNNPAPSSIEAKIARIVFDMPTVETRDLSLDAGLLAGYAGDYEVRPFSIGFERIGFIAQDGKLFLRFGGVEAPGPMIPLFAQGDGLFRASFDDEWTFQFPSDQSGKLVSQYRDGTFTALPAPSP